MALNLGCRVSEIPLSTTTLYSPLARLAYLTTGKADDSWKTFEKSCLALPKCFEHTQDSR